MTERSVTHSTFTLERTYDASPARVFAAFADPDQKAQWFAGPEEWTQDAFEVDFVAGRLRRGPRRQPGQRRGCRACRGGDHGPRSTHRVPAHIRYRRVPEPSR